MSASLGLIVCAFLATIGVTPLVRRLAIRWHLVDEPDGHRKLHSIVTPLGGGIAILVGSALTLTGVWFVRGRFDFARHFLPDEHLGLFAALLVLCGIGLVDDRFGLRGRQKL